SQAVADGAVHQYRRDRGVDATGEGADGRLLPELAGDGRHRGLDVVLGGPITRAGADAVEEVTQNLAAKGGVRDFRVELQPDVAVGIGHGGEGAVLAGCYRAVAGGELLHVVAVAHPD